MEEEGEKGSGDGFIMDPCLVSLVAADYHGYKPVKHHHLSSSTTHPPMLKRKTANLTLYIQHIQPKGIQLISLPKKIM